MAKDASSEGYVVVARRYRPQTFEDLIGQQQASQALTNAIQSRRVGHAYLFTGARGVGKTSTARIFAKALNCEKGPTPVPCNECDICQRISVGEDVDVLEIDGASNRGIDEIRQLRSNVNIRPSRERYKIYIIDEVHMLTQAAFNALLKTLEEPPEHVKFIFCTTDPEKIPITVLSRCQRFDFAPASTEAILDRLTFIAENENVKADSDALRILARRAEGSMRDSQSLLEQLLAFCPDTITVDDVHRLLGTAPSGRLSKLLTHLTNRDAAAALAEVDAAASEGVDMGQLSEQIIGYLRDMMAATVGCGENLMRHTSPSDFADLSETGKQVGLSTLLAMAQIMDQTLTRQRHSTQGRLLVEMALVRICQLENLEELSALIGQVSSGQAPSVKEGSRPKKAPPQKKSNDSVSAPLAAPPSPPVERPAPAADAPSQRAPVAPSTAPVAPSKPAAKPASQPSTRSAVTSSNAGSIWKKAIGTLEGLVAQYAADAEGAANFGPNRLVVTFRAKYNFSKEQCERPELRKMIEQAVAHVAGSDVKVDFEVSADVAEETKEPPKTHLSRQERMRQMRSHPFVKEALKLFDGDLAFSDS